MTLTAVATLTRRFILLSVLFLILGIAGFIGYKIWYANYLSSIPPVEEQPDAKWGSLPRPDFPPTDVSSSNFSYTLDTTTGGLPTFDKLIKVYFIPKAYATFLASDKSQNLANQFGFNVSPTIISETKYLFTQDNKSLAVDLDTGNFNYKQEASNSSIPSQTTTPKTETIAEEFKNFLDSKQLLKGDLRDGLTKATPITDGDTNAFEISIWPTKIDNNKIITAYANKSLINASVVNNAREIGNYTSLNFIYWPVDTSTFSTYLSKPTGTAFNDLKSGEGIIIQEPLKPQVSITSVYLAYYQQTSYSPYLQPIYVFEGPHFQAYVPALDNQFVTNQSIEN